MFCHARSGAHYYEYDGDIYRRFEYREDDWAYVLDIIVEQVSTGRNGRTQHVGRSRRPGETDLSSTWYTITLSE